MRPGNEPNPYEAPSAQDDPPDPIERAALGDSVAFTIGEAIPPVCLKCGATDDILRRTERFSWAKERSKDPILKVYLSGMLGDFLSIALTGKGRMFAKLDVPLCEPCASRLAVARAGVTGAQYSFVLIGVAGIAIAHRVGVGVTLAMAALALVLGELAARAVKKRSLFPVHIDERVARLGGVSPIARERLAEMNAKARRRRAKAKRTPRLPPVEPIDKTAPDPE